MDATKLQSAIDASRTFTQQHGDFGLSFDTLAMMHYLEHPNITNTTTIVTNTTPAPTHAHSTVPAWFSESLVQFAGRRVTAKDVVEALGRPTDMGSLRDAGAWLRALYGEPSRSGGRVLYRIPYADAAAQQQPEIRATAATVPSWMQQLIAQHRRNLSGTMGAQAVAEVLGIPRNPVKLAELSAHLAALGYSAPGGMFYFG